MKNYSWLLGLALLMSGCSGKGDGPGYVAVTGVVTLDGHAVEGAHVTFTPAGGAGNSGTVSMGITNSEGKFSLRTGTGKIGAAIGEHKVAVELMIAPEAEPEQITADGLAPAMASELGSPQKSASKGPAKPLYLVPKKYADPLTSGLTATVPSGGLKDLALELSSK